MTRQDVENQLAWADVGLDRPSVFWARWRSSAALDLNRWGDQRTLWRGHSVVVEFDESGRVRQFHEFVDKDLVAGVDSWLSGKPRPDHPTPVPVVGRLRKEQSASETRLLFGERSLTFEGVRTVPIQGVNHVKCMGTGASPSEVRLSLRFREASAVDQELIFDMEIPDLVSFLEFLRQRQPGALR